MIPGRRLRVIALPPLQDVMVGQIFGVSAEVDSTDPAEVTIAFPEALFEMVSEAPVVSAPAGTAQVNWTLYCKGFRPELVDLQIRAVAGDLRQFAVLRVRISANADS